MPTVIVWGPPCAGKTTYIREHARAGDLVVDLDRIAQALTTDDVAPHDYPQHVRDAAHIARTAIIDRAADWGLGSLQTAWIVDSNATAGTLSQWQGYGCSIVRILTDYDTCIARAKAERPERVQAHVDAWFARHG